MTTTLRAATAWLPWRPAPGGGGGVGLGWVGARHYGNASGIVDSTRVPSAWVVGAGRAGTILLRPMVPVYLKPPGYGASVGSIRVLNVAPPLFFLDTLEYVRGGVSGVLSAELLWECRVSRALDRPEV